MRPAQLMRATVVVASSCARDVLLSRPRTARPRNLVTLRLLQHAPFVASTLRIADDGRLENMQVASGTRLGPYEITARVGAGGMGEVWAAHDTRLDRDVAVKVLPESVAGDAERLRRFEQEARAAGAINHPNLLTVYDTGSQDGIAYVVMELLEGETLRDKIGEAVTNEGSRVPIRKAVDYAAQIANGLAAAHDKGIVHRDLKPENVFVTRDGRVKILDFGLAKLTARTDGDSGEDRTQQRGTTPGTVFGTAGYMSPEQVRGREVDHRTDIFSFGAVLYEMLAGRRAFRRDSSVETMNAILKEDPPDLQDVKTPVSPGLERIVRRCLEKAPEERFQSAHDIAFALDAVTSTSSQRAVIDAPPSRRRMTVAAAVAAAVLLCALTAAVTWRAARRATPAAAAAAAPAARTFTQLTVGSRELFPSLSPDGKTFAFTGNAAEKLDIYVQRVDGRNAINLTKDSTGPSSEPAFSPDGNQIAFRSERDGGGIFIMGATGESVRRLSDFGYNPSWSPDGTQIAVGTDDITINPRARGNSSELWILDVRSGAKRRIKVEDAVQPSWSPHGDRIAYWALIGEGGQRDLWTIDPRAADPAKTATRLTKDAALDWNPVWSADGKWLYFGSDRDGTLNLWRMPIDERSGKPRGAMEAVTLPARFTAHFSFARNTGDMAFTAIDQTETTWEFSFDPIALRVTGEPLRIMGGALLTFLRANPSPDGQWWTFSNTGAQEDIYLMRHDGSGLRQLTNDPEKDRVPAFSADGKLIYFYSPRGSRYEIWSIRLDGSDLRQVSTTTGRSLWYPRPLPGRNALLANNETGTVVLPFNADGSITRVEPLLAANAAQALVLGLSSPTDDGAMLVGPVLRPMSMQGIWTYTFAARQYERISESVGEVQWLPHSNRTVLANIHDKLVAIDIATKQEKAISLPLRRIGVFSMSPDGRTLHVSERSQETVVWLMRGMR
jgi:eukaryotic-like serine/threonine-protein kinase